MLTDGRITGSSIVMTISGDALMIKMVLRGVSGEYSPVLSRLLMWQRCGGTENLDHASHKQSDNNALLKSESSGDARKGSV